MKSKDLNLLFSWSFVLNLIFIKYTIDFFIGRRLGVAPILLGVVGAGVGITTSFTQQFLPQLLWFTTATPADINIKVSGDGTVWDVAGLGVNEFATVRQYSRTANFFLLQLSTGLVTGKMVTYSITNQTASAFNVYGDSKRTPVGNQSQYIAANQQVCLASSGFTFRNFMYLSFPAAGAADRYNVTYSDGTQQPFDSRDELKAVLQLYQNSISTVGFNIDNVGGEIKAVQVIPAAQQTAYVMYRNPVGMINTDVYKQ